jgi:hypothetical protein
MRKHFSHSFNHYGRRGTSTVRSSGNGWGFRERNVVEEVTKGRQKQVRVVLVSSIHCCMFTLNLWLCYECFCGNVYDQVLSCFL